MVFKDLIRTSDLQVPEPALFLYDCWRCFFLYNCFSYEACNVGPPTCFHSLKNGKTCSACSRSSVNALP